MSSITKREENIEHIELDDLILINIKNAKTNRIYYVCVCRGFTTITFLFIYIPLKNRFIL